MLQSKDTDLIMSSMKYIDKYSCSLGEQRNTEQIIRKYKKKPIWAAKYSNGNKKHTINN